MPILILPPNPAWPQHFADIARLLHPAAPPGAAIHHIGSTAVPGLVAKPIIDVQISVPDLETLDLAAFLALGLTLTPHVSDHCPPGLTLPPDQLAKRLVKATTPHPAHIHIRQTGRFNQRYPLLCRDYLRAHPLAAAAYGTIKQNLARLFPNDQEAYYDIKDPVFDLIMAGAEDWAAQTRWTPPPPDSEPVGPRPEAR